MDAVAGRVGVGKGRHLIESAENFTVTPLSLESRAQLVEIGKEHRQNSHLLIHFPTSEGVSEVSEQANE